MDAPFTALGAARPDPKGADDPQRRLGVGAGIRADDPRLPRRQRPDQDGPLRDRLVARGVAGAAERPTRPNRPNTSLVP